MAANLEGVKSDFISKVSDISRTLAGLDGLYLDLKGIESQYSEFYANGQSRALVDGDDPGDFRGANSHMTKSDLNSALVVLSALLGVFENDENNSNLHKLEALV